MSYRGTLLGEVQVREMDITSRINCSDSGIVDRLLVFLFYFFYFFIFLLLSAASSSSSSSSSSSISVLLYVGCFPS